MAAAFAGRAQPQYPVFTADHLDQSMRTLGLAFDLVSATVTKQEFGEAKDYLARAREQLAITITFWRDRNRDDAVAILKDALTKMDQLDAALSAASVDPGAATGLTRQVDAACQTCHAQYREQDPATKAYRLKAGL